jgi:hypothetical protein
VDLGPCRGEAVQCRASPLGSEKKMTASPPTPTCGPRHGQLPLLGLLPSSPAQCGCSGATAWRHVAMRGAKAQGLAFIAGSQPRRPANGDEE